MHNYLHLSTFARFISVSSFMSPFHQSCYYHAFVYIRFLSREAQHYEKSNVDSKKELFLSWIPLYQKSAHQLA